MNDNKELEERLQAILKDWAKRENLDLQDLKIDLRLNETKTDGKVVWVKPPPMQSTGRKPTEEDWVKISALPWAEKPLSMINAVRQNPENHLIPKHVDGNSTDIRAASVNLNNMFRRNNMHYRFIYDGIHRSKLNGPYGLFVTEERTTSKISMRIKKIV